MNIKKFLSSLVVCLFIGFFFNVGISADKFYFLDIIIMGASGSGKTALRSVLCDEGFDFSSRLHTKYSSAAFVASPVQVGRKNVQFVYWDTSGDRHVQDEILENCTTLGKVFIVTFDVSALDFSKDIGTQISNVVGKRYITQICAMFGDNIPPIFVVATKADLCSNSKIKKLGEVIKKGGKGLGVSGDYDIPFFVTSAKSSAEAMMDELRKRLSELGLASSTGDRGSSEEVIHYEVLDVPDISEKIKDLLESGRIDINKLDSNREAFEKKMMSFKERKLCAIL